MVRELKKKKKKKTDALQRASTECPKNSMDTIEIFLYSQTKMIRLKD